MLRTSSSKLNENGISINKRVFQELFDLHFNALCAFGRRFVQNDGIEDIVQEAFITFWQKRKDFDNSIAAKSFLYKSVRNKCLNHIRDEIVQQKHLQNGIGPDTDFEYFVIEEEVFNQLYNEIKNLPPASQRVMILAINGLKNQEIATELDISLNTVKTQKKIAYTKLKNRMGSVMHSVLVSL